MSNPFKKKLPKHKVSPIVKQKVLVDIQMIKQTLDIAEMYMRKNPKTRTNYFINLEN
ncbi:hypothetical protein [uncultured Polaribacter sp.]|uniref:hypothetical protein n=1 Tax=uncultured Polaribacter sp. TaxID=174711 RepID=UPI0026085FF6|nr:hypothetical protein [uncultured Polaribacter sp.]